MNHPQNNKITIVINSCDAYEDLWVPFFTLFKKYWNPEGVRILLNTESKDFHFDGLQIECIHPEHVDDPYGARMLHALSQVKTPYVLPLLDDFFLRKPVDHDLINKIVQWMDEDKHIAYFNCDCTKTFIDFEVNKYPGFKRIPNGNEYTLNMQAAVWRTKRLFHYWRPQVSPWEWECFTNLCAARNKTDKFYCVTDLKNAFADYGYTFEGMGVYRGQWVKEDIVPLFEKEGIHVDYSKRGFYTPKTQPQGAIELRPNLKTITASSDLIERCLDRSDYRNYKKFLKKNKIIGLLRFSPDLLYILYFLAFERKKHVKRQAIKQKVLSVLRKGFVWRKSP